MERLTKSQLNPQIHIVEGNSKLVGADDIQFLIYNILSKVTCPYRTDICEYVCYATLEENFRKNVRESRASNYIAAQDDNFVNDMITHIEWQLGRKKFNGKDIYFRIHSAGDFFNLRYAAKWLKIANFFKDDDRILFQAYTKSLPLFERIVGLEDKNITLVYSVMPDTKKADIEKARELGLKLFIAVNPGEIPEGAFKCNGQCGPCTACYHKDNGINEIYTEFHGARAKSVKRVKGL